MLKADGDAVPVRATRLARGHDDDITLDGVRFSMFDVSETHMGSSNHRLGFYHHDGSDVPQIEKTSYVKPLHMYGMYAIE